ncbi:Fatty acid synthase [Halotydeus destructor]|nr:Fatty acid synthase [Halotydeus destructor]
MRAACVRNVLSSILPVRASLATSSSSRVSFFSTKAKNGTTISDQHRQAVITKFHDLLQCVEIHGKPGDTSGQISNIGSNGAKKRPLWLGLSSLGCHWPGMGKSLMSIPVFAESIKNSSKVLDEVSLDVRSCIMDETCRTTDIVQNTVATVVMEIALIDVLYSAGLQADGFIGLSLAEFGCGYADGAMSARQTLLAIYHHSSITARKLQGQHAMAAICMTKEQIEKRRPKGIHVGFNGGNICGIGGLKEDVKLFMDTLKAENVSGNLVDTGGVAYHTSLIAGCREEVSMATEKLFPEPIRRTSRWLNAILVEVGPNSFLLSFLQHEVTKDAILVPLLEGGNNDRNLDVFLGGLARIHAHGHHVDIEKLFDV